MSSVIWKPIPGYEGVYEVSNTGRVKRLLKLKGEKISPMSYALSLSSKGKVKQCFVSDIVAEVFIGPKPENHKVNHIDGNTRNNNVKNLQYVASQKPRTKKPAKEYVYEKTE